MSDGGSGGRSDRATATERRASWADADSRLTRAFAGEPALVAYVVAGDPGPGEGTSPAGVAETTAHVEALVEGGADVVELGLPFSEPIAEGTPIQNGIRRALDGGMSPDRYLDLVADLDVDAPLVCMTYYNLLYRYGAAQGGEAGPEAFVADAADAGLAGFIVPDLPVEEAGPLHDACDDHGLDLVGIVAPTTRGERLDRVLAACRGFVYVQSRLGTTGARTDVSDQTYDSLARLGDADLPKAVGFGVSRGEDARAIVAGGADGVVAGSVFVDAVAAGEDEDAPDRLAAIARELKDGAVEGMPKPERT